jgi:hypothetical protein
MLKKPFATLLLLSSLPALIAGAKELKTNAIRTSTAPAWVTQGRVDRVVDRIQQILEWDIRRVEVTWYKDKAEFEKMHGLGPTVLAISRRSNNTVHIGPNVTTENFDATFGHEMSHIISFQKYKDAIPKWLEEGVANFVAKSGTVDYAYLASHEAPKDVRDLTHPFDGTVDHIRYHYLASQALAEMLHKKCTGLSNLLRISVRKSVENHLANYCEIKDLTASYKKWVAEHK